MLKLADVNELLAIIPEPVPVWVTVIVLPKTTESCPSVVAARATANITRTIVLCIICNPVLAIIRPDCRLPDFYQENQ